MPSLFIIAHAPLASALKEAAGHCFPDAAAQLQILDVSAQWSMDELQTRAQALLVSAQASDERGEVLILADVFGATPCNTVQRLADGQKTKVVTGVNVPMLWRALNYASQPLESLVERAVAGGAQGVMQIALCAPQNQSGTVVAHDQNQRNHQQ